jgi:ABC-type transport system substrate-binding protein
LFKPEWVIPFDTDMAKQYLADAGHPNCLKFTFFIPPDSGHPPEVGEAVALNWTSLGCDVEIEKTSYSVRRPTEVNRQIDIPWMFQWGGRPLSMDQNIDPIRFSQPGWNPGVEDLKFHEWFFEQAGDASVESRIQRALEWTEYDHFNQLAVPIVGRPLLIAVNPEFLEGWTPHREGVQESAINNLETARPAR